MTGYAMKVPHLTLVCAEREPQAGTPNPLGTNGQDDSLPSGPAVWAPDGGQTASRSANPTGLDVVDLSVLSSIVLPRLLVAVGELDIATQEGNQVAAITACRRILACAMMAKGRADSLEKRLP